MVKDLNTYSLRNILFINLSGSVSYSFYSCCCTSSARKRLMQKLNDQGVPPNQLVQISGHKNLNSLNNYSKLNQHQAMAVSDILSSGGSFSCVRFSKSENVQNVQAQIRNCLVTLH